MAFAVLFVLVCLAPFAIVCDKEYDWVPEEVPLAAQQCLDLGFNGQCVSSSRPLIFRNICSNLRCADGSNEPYFLSSTYKTRDGTKCGDNAVCHGIECINIPESIVPRYTGRDITRLC